MTPRVTSSDSASTRSCYLVYSPTFSSYANLLVSVATRTPTSTTPSPRYTAHSRRPMPATLSSLPAANPVLIINRRCEEGVAHVRLCVGSLCQICRPPAFCTTWRSDQSTKAGVEDHQPLCRQAGEGQPRALPHQPWRRSGCASTTGGRGRASSRLIEAFVHWLDWLKADRQRAFTRWRETVKTPFFSVSSRGSRSANRLQYRVFSEGGDTPHPVFACGWLFFFRLRRAAREVTLWLFSRLYPHLTPTSLKR